MFSENEIEALVDIFIQRQDNINTMVLTKIGKSLNLISRLSTSEAQQIQLMYDYGADIDSITNMLSSTSGKTTEEIYKIYLKAASDNYNFAKVLYANKGITQMPYADNIVLQEIVRAMAVTTAGNMVNLSNTTALGFVDSKNIFKPIKEAYHDIIDEAIQTVATGIEDFQSAIYDSLKQLGSSGVRVLYNNLETGNESTRRIDTVVRQHILDGVRDINQTVQDYIGQQIGADGKEISVHNTCAPDHLPYQGRQFTNVEYKQLQNNLDREIGKYNCRHFTFSIIFGVSIPAHSYEELEKIRKEQSTKNVEYEGKKYTQYEASQIQRKLETAIRIEKDKTILAEAAGNQQLYDEAQGKIQMMSKRYKEFSGIAKLPVNKNRLRVPGYIK